MPANTAVPYRNAWVMIPTLASERGTKFPSNQHTRSVSGLAPVPIGALVSAGVVAGGFWVSMRPSIRRNRDATAPRLEGDHHQRQIGQVEGATDQQDLS